MKNNDDLFGTMFDFDGDSHTDISETYIESDITDDYILTYLTEQERISNNK